MSTRNRWLRRIAFAALMLLAHAAWPGQRDWFANTSGLGGGGVAVTHYRDSGIPARYGSGILPGGSWPDVVHVAWPSAVALPGGGVRVYASGYDGTRWAGVTAWESSTGEQPFNRIGGVITISGDDPGGMMQAHVVRDPDDTAAPWKLWYTSIGVGNSYRVVYATSNDGLSWTRQGTAYAQSTPYDAGALTSDYVCRTAAGLWTLWLTAYPTGMGSSSALLATSANPEGPFTAVAQVASPGGASTTITGAGQQRSSVLAVADAAGIVAGGAYLVSDGTQARSQVVTVLEVQPVVLQALLVQPLAFDAQGLSLTAIQRRYISPSYVREHPDGAWSGRWSAYHAVQGVVAEYTYAVTAPSMAGQWAIDYSRPAPYFRAAAASAVYSTENPSPVSSSARCE